MTKNEFESRFDSICQDFNNNEVKSVLDKMDTSGKNLQEQIAVIFNTYLILNQQFVKSVLQGLLLDNH